MYTYIIVKTIFIMNSIFHRMLNINLFFNVFRYFALVENLLRRENTEDQEKCKHQIKH